MSKLETVTKTIIPTLPNFKCNTYEDCVRAAKICVVRLTHYRVFIAELALKACEIRHGGGGHWNGFADQKTIGSFAKDIGIHRKTLSEWVSFKRCVVDKLKDGEIDVTNYKLVRRVHDEVRRQAANNLHIPASSVDSELVRAVLKSEKERDLEGEEILLALKYIRNIHHKLFNKWKLPKKYHRDLRLIAQYCEEIKELVRDNCNDGYPFDFERRIPEHKKRTFAKVGGIE